MTKSLDSSLLLVAFEQAGSERYCINKAPGTRGWMDETAGHAYRCKPMVIANQAGWIIPCPTTVTVLWDGTDSQDGLIVSCDDPWYSEKDPNGRKYINSHFGHGVVTFTIPWLFRTSMPGLGLKIGPTPNYWIDGMTGLTGIVETWGHVSSFTMNWKVTQANTLLTIPKGAPICFIEPYDFSLIEATVPVIAGYELMADELRDEYEGWIEERWQRINNELSNVDGAYARGRDLRGAPIEPHWRTLRVANFGLATEDQQTDAPAHGTEGQENAITSNQPQD